jgi:spoIIIJ-associated protein
MGAEERVRELLELIASALAVEATIEISESDGELVASFVGDDVAPVIGHHGATLEAIQHLAYRIAYHGGSGRGRVTVDAGGYRERRATALRAVADQAVVAAVRDGKPVALDPMSASERKVVHEYLKDRFDVETYSEGQEPSRRLVVAPLVG